MNTKMPLFQTMERETYLKALEEIEMCINELEQQLEKKDSRITELTNQLRWIPTNEQLPIKRKPIYMIAIEGKYITDQYGGWYFGDSKWGRWPHPFPPTHWIYQIPNPEVKGERKHNHKHRHIASRCRQNSRA